MRTKISSILALIVGLLLIPMAASASLSSYTYTLSAPNSTISNYTGPYATVKVDLDTATPTIATIKAEGLTNGGYIYLLGDGGSLDLNVNVNSAMYNISNISATYLTGFSNGNYYSNGSNNISEFGNFNASLKNNGGFMEAAQTLTLTLTNTSGGTWANASDVLAKNDKNFLAAAHIYVWDGTYDHGKPNDAKATGFVATPIPAAAWLLGSGLLGLVGIRRKKTA